MLPFVFATGIENSAPTIADGRIRRDQMEECGHYRCFREDLALVRELGTPCLRYGLANHLISRYSNAEDIPQMGRFSYLFLAFPTESAQNASPGRRPRCDRASRAW